MSSIKGIVNQVVNGKRELDVRTAEKIIKKASRDERIDLESELQPLQQLFVGDSFKEGVSGTTTGKKLLQGFYQNANKLYSDIGESDSPRVRQLKSVSVQYTAELLSEDAVHDLISQYRGTTAEDDYYHTYNSTTSIDEVTPDLVDAWREHTQADLVKYLEKGPVARFFQKLFLGAKYTKNYYEADVTSGLKAYLETYSVKKDPNVMPLDLQIEKLETNKITQALSEANGDIAQAAITLGMDKDLLANKVAFYEIELPVQ